jgi:hypothetical protein
MNIMHLKQELTSPRGNTLPGSWRSTYVLWCCLRVSTLAYLLLIAGRAGMCSCQLLHGCRATILPTFNSNVCVFPRTCCQTKSVLTPDSGLLTSPKLAHWLSFDFVHTCYSSTNHADIPRPSEARTRIWMHKITKPTAVVPPSNADITFPDVSGRFLDELGFPVLGLRVLPRGGTQLQTEAIPDRG